MPRQIPSHYPSAKLIALHPFKPDVPIFNGKDLTKTEKFSLNSEWKIYKRNFHDIWIKNLSAYYIRVNDSWLGMYEEKRLFGGERIAFHKDLYDTDENFDYVFYRKRSNVSRKRDQSEESDVKEICFVEQVAPLEPVYKLWSGVVLVSDEKKWCKS